MPRLAACAAVCAVCVSCALVLAAPAAAFTQHPAVTVRAAAVDFYAGHLVLDAIGRATLDDGVAHVAADRIVVDLGSARYVAAGHVVITAAAASSAPIAGEALGIDLDTHAGTLVVLDPAPRSYAVNGAAIAASPPAASPQPLPLVDLQGELPFATAAAAVAHLGADVRLSSARVLVPGGRDVFIPSYVYTFSSEVGYSQSNVVASEDVPVYFGSTRDSVSGAHFTYDPVTKVGLGLDHRIVDGDKAYDLFSVSPIYGPMRNANFTWREQIDAHTSQTVSGATSSGAGSRWNYDVTDGVHRSFFDLSGSSSLFGDGQTLTWQGAYEPLGAGWVGNTFDFHLRSEYGRSQSYFGDITPLYHTAFESTVQVPYLSLDRRSSLNLSADWRATFDDFPHRQFAAAYGATLTHQWNRSVTTSLSDSESPVFDYYPSLPLGARSYVSAQVGTISYSHGDALAYTAGLTHEAGRSDPPGISVVPWYATLDVRFRVGPTLALELSRSYAFGFNGQRYGAIGFQIFP